MAERDFSDFVLGDNVYELADGMIPELAEQAGLSPTDEPDTELIGRLVGILGKNKVLRDNEEVDFLTPAEMADYVDRAGTQKVLHRSLWTPDFVVPEGSTRILTGAVANWQDRAARLLIDQPTAARAHIVTGNRVMDTKTEITNPNVVHFMETFDTAPTEMAYAANYIVPLLEEAGWGVVMREYDTDKGDEIAARFVRDYEELFAKDQALGFVRVANAGVQMAVQFREAARQHNPSYDSDAQSPQVYIQTDTFPVARTEEERKSATTHQNPQTGLRQAVLTAKLLHEAAQD